MSRIGKVPVIIPEKVTVSVNYPNVKVKGPKGELSFNVNENVNVEIQDKKVVITPKKDSPVTSKVTLGNNLHLHLF
jgi:large subunit ribosomal protein L6